MSVNLSQTLPFASLPQAQGAELSQSAGGFQSPNRSGSVQAFDDAMRAANTQGIEVAQLSGNIQINQVNQAQPVSGVENGLDAVKVSADTSAQPVTAVGASADVDARARAAQGLDLGTPAVSGLGASDTGSSIMGGLEQLRSVFDGKFDSLGSKLEGGTRMDVSEMMALQADVIQYSLLVDVSSKLAGKSTQAMDSLMKGQ